MNERHLATAQLLVTRLERLSADSFWAHRASGMRGSLLRLIELIEQGCDSEITMVKLEDLLLEGFAILEKGALEYYRDKSTINLKPD